MRVLSDDAFKGKIPCGSKLNTVMCASWKYKINWDHGFFQQTDPVVYDWKKQITHI